MGVRSQVVDGELEVVRVDCRNRQGCNDPRRKLDDVEEETVCGRFYLGLGESMGNSLCRWKGQGKCHDQVIDDGGTSSMAIPAKMNRDVVEDLRERRDELLVAIDALEQLDAQPFDLIAADAGRQ